VVQGNKRRINLSYLVVITFDDPDEAGKVRQTLSTVEHTGHLSLDDSAIVIKDDEGKVHLKNEVERGVKIGAVGGSMLGLLIGSVFFPIGGLVIGALGGALVGKLANTGVSQDFVKQVSEQMKPGSSAIFFIVHGDDPDMTVAALREYKGKVLQTTLAEEAEQTLRRELEGRSWE
jgi:uncharacterized membrane protein